jgi:hypothetical protein
VLHLEPRQTSLLMLLGGQHLGQEQLVQRLASLRTHMHLLLLPEDHQQFEFKEEADNNNNKL